MTALPDADLLVLTLLRAALPTANLGTQLPHDVHARMPFGAVRRFGGASVDPRFLDRASFGVDTWAGTRAGAFELASSIRTALRDAAINQTTCAYGHIVRFRESSAPSELRAPDQADNVWRFSATYSLFLRPASI